MKIGYRTIKTAIGTPLAISIAQLLGLTNFVSAGILTILCIQPSRKRSYYSALHRFIACIIATLYAYIFFEWIAYHPLVLGIMLIVFIPTTVFLKVTPYSNELGCYFKLIQCFLHNIGISIRSISINCCWYWRWALIKFVYAESG